MAAIAASTILGDVLSAQPDDLYSTSGYEPLISPSLLAGIALGD